MELLLERIATAETPRFHSLIDTGALITGYSNQEVAEKLLAMGLKWCEGVVFLDDDDRQQVGLMCLFYSLIISIISLLVSSSLLSANAIWMWFSISCCCYG